MEMDQSGAFGRFTAEYRLTDRTRLTGELRGVAFSGDGENSALFQTRDAGGALTGAYSRDGEVAFDLANFGATARVVHRFDDAGHEWSNELRYDDNGTDSEGLAVSRFTTPAAPDVYERTRQNNDQVNPGLHQRLCAALRRSRPDAPWL